MITLYFSELDEASHDHPLESPEVVKAAQSLDSAIGELVDGIDQLTVRDQVYLLITSDHGMVNTSTAQTVRLESILDAPEIASVDCRLQWTVRACTSPVAPTRPADPRSHQRRVARGTAYLRQDLPARFNYRDNPRTGDVVMVMDEGWTISASRPARGHRGAGAGRRKAGRANSQARRRARTARAIRRTRLGQRVPVDACAVHDRRSRHPGGRHRRRSPQRGRLSAHGRTPSASRRLRIDGEAGRIRKLISK